jgi:glycosyltransferase involved in cell wall biosynthesis
MISVLIRNKNEGAALENALKSVRLQQFTLPVEIVLVDDYSTDNSLDVAQKYNCSIYKLDKPFTYGYALNFGIVKCKYEIIVVMSSHNILLNPLIFEKLQTYFQDQTVAGVRFTPIHSAKQIVGSLNGVREISKINFSSKNDWGELLIANCSAIRKQFALEIPFNEKIRSNEEKLWSLNMIEAGNSIITNSGCYYIYNHGHKTKSLVRDTISKFQIDGKDPMTTKEFIVYLTKVIAKTILDFFFQVFGRIKYGFDIFTIKFKFKQGDFN